MAWRLHRPGRTYEATSRLREGDRERDAAERDLLAPLDQDQREQLGLLLRQLHPSENQTGDAAYDPDGC